MIRPLGRAQHVSKNIAGRVGSVREVFGICHGDRAGSRRPDQARPTKVDTLVRPDPRELTGSAKNLGKKKAAEVPYAPRPRLKSSFPPPFFFPRECLWVIDVESRARAMIAR